MNVLVDTSVWSTTLRRSDRSPDASRQELIELINEQRIEIIGPIRQELLSGIRAPEQFERIRDHLAAFRDLALDEADYEGAARMFDLCRGRGVQGSNTDFLICGVAKRRGLSIFTSDRDFERFAAVLDLTLHSART